MGPTVRRRYPTIERVPVLDPGTLRRDYLAANRPVVFSAGGDAFRARWSPCALAERYGRFPVDAEEVREVYVGDRARVTRSLADIVRALRADDKTLRWKGVDFLSLVPGMRDDLAASPPPHHAYLPGSAHAFRDTLWLAPRATTSSLHHDGDFDNLNLQIAGRKLFLLLPPPRHEVVHWHGSAESPVNPFIPDLDRFPRFAGADPVEATLAPGEVLFLPKYWWHCVYAVEASVNLSTHFHWDGELRPWRVLRGAPLVHRSLTAVAAAMKRRGFNRLADTTRRAWCAAHATFVPRVEPQGRRELTEPVEWTDRAET